MRAVLVLLVASRVAFAQPEPFDVRSPAAAEKAKQLFEEGRTLLAAGKRAEACAKFRESWRMDQAPGTGLNLGECEEHAGALRAAWGLYDAAARTSEHKGSEARASFARERADALVPKLGRVQVRFAESRTDIVVQIDGRFQDFYADVDDYVMAGKQFVVLVKRGRRFHRFGHTVAAGETLVIDVPPMEQGNLEPAPPPPPQTVRFIETERYRSPYVAVGATLMVGGAVALGAAVWHGEPLYLGAGILAELTGIGVLALGKEHVVLRINPSSSAASASLQMRF